tara:strand:+ start:785 stop:1477 length:693 start_codon:yes stop_codon:yes gene_type:complete
LDFRFETSLDEIKAVEKELLGHNIWDKMKIKEHDLRKAKNRIRKHLKAIYNILLPLFSNLSKNVPSYKFRNFENLFGMLIAVNRSDFSYYCRETFSELFHWIKQEYLETLPDEIFKEISHFENVLISYSRIFHNHRRRVLFDRAKRESRFFYKIEREIEKKDLGESQKKVLENHKTTILRWFNLEPRDLTFLDDFYKNCTPGQLTEFLSSVFAVSEAKILILGENRPKLG